MLSFKPTFSLSSFTFIKKLFSASSLCAIGWCHLHMLDYWYVSWQSWFQLVLLPAQHFTWCTLHICWISSVTIYSLEGYSFPDLEPVCCSTSSSNCCFLTCIQISQAGGQVVWCSHLLRIFHSLLWSTQRLWHSQWSRSRCFPETLLLFLWINRCWQVDLWFLCLF